MTRAWLSALAALLFALPLLARTDMSYAQEALASTAVTGEMYDGQVRRINKETGRVTLTHGPLTGFSMPAMTMAFAVKNPKQLALLKEGDKVRFALEQSGENLVVTRIDVVK